MTTIAHPLNAAWPVPVFGGVNTHADTHTAAVIDSAGRLLAHRQFEATPGGYAELVGWLTSHDQVQTVGVEGSGVYEAGLARHLTAAGMRLVEVDRPDRKTRTGPVDPAHPRRGPRAAACDLVGALTSRLTAKGEARRSAIVERLHSWC
jgi:transposase